MDSLVQDIRYAFRTLKSHPGFTAVVVLTLMLGIGASTTIFSVLNTVLLSPLPYDDPEELVVFWSESDNKRERVTSGPAFLDYRRYHQVFEDIAAVTGDVAHVTSEGEPERLDLAAASENFLPLLGVELFLGRHFTEEEARRHGPKAAILTYDLWQRRYGGDPNVLGKTIVLDGKNHEVVGVLPSDFKLILPSIFRLKPPVDLWVSLQVNSAGTRSGWYLLVLGRLSQGATMAEAHGETERISQQLRSEHLEYETGKFRLSVTPLHDDLVGDVDRKLLVLMAAVGFVLLIACANVANMQLAQAMSRGSELTIRSALGASRSRLLRQALTETFVLAAIGGALGLALGAIGLSFFVKMLPPEIPRVDDVQIDGRVLLFTLAATLMTGILFGLYPALRASTPRLTDTLRQTGRGGGTKAGYYTQRLLVMAEITLSMVLLIGAGLMFRSFFSLGKTYPGFDARNVLTFSLTLMPNAYPSDESVSVFHRQLRQKIAALPGVESVGMISAVPLSGRIMTITHALDDEDRTSSPVDYLPVDPGYFDTMKTKILAGRDIGDQDRLESRRVIVIDETVAKQVWPGKSAVGEQLTVNTVTSVSPFRMDTVPVDVVGVVEHIRTIDLSKVVHGQVYVPYDQLPFRKVDVVVRANNPMSLLGPIKQQIADLDKAMPVVQPRLLEEFTTDALAPTWLVMMIFGIFAAFATVLATIGIYGVLSYIVNQRFKEMGIRMAMGATSGDVLRLIVGQGMRSALLGVGLGLVCAAVFSRFLASLLYGVGFMDPATLVTVTALLVVTALLACLIPARRATHIDPVAALRAE